jgi:predicted nucleic acid-binding protein
MAAEATNAWWQKLRRHEMEQTDVEQAVTNLLASELGDPVYDCLYLALAVSFSAPLATADKRLRQAAERIGVRIRA